MEPVMMWLRHSLDGGVEVAADFQLHCCGRMVAGTETPREEHVLPSPRGRSVSR